MQTDLTYFLPQTLVRLRATLTEVSDALAPGPPVVAASAWSAELLTVADPTQPRTLSVSSGLLFDYGIKLALTDDGRLTSADVDTTGQVGRVLVSVAGLAVGLASSVVFRTPLPPPRRSPGDVLGEASDEAATEPEPPSYADAHPAEAARLAALQAQFAAAQDALVAARDATIGGATDDASWRDYQRLRRLADDVAADLDRAKAHRDAWRRSQQTTRESVASVTVSPSALPLLTCTPDGTHTLAWGSAPVAELVRFVRATGRVLARTDPDAASPSASPPGADLVPVTSPPAPGPRLHLRRPRPVGLAAVQLAAPADTDDALTGPVWITDVRRELVADDACAELDLPLRRSWLAKRRTAVTLSPLGALVGVEWGGTSAVAGAATAVSDASAAALASLSSADKARAALGSLAAADETDAVAHAKRLVALAEQRLLAEGQAATAADYARLEGAKQQVALAEAEAKLAALRR